MVGRTQPAVVMSSESIEYLTATDVLVAGSAACRFVVNVGDAAQLAANVARPSTSAFGEDAFEGAWMKAAALMHSFATTQCLLDGNKRTAWAAAWLMLRLNGAVEQLAWSLNVDGAERLVLDTAGGGLSVTSVASRLRQMIP